MHAQHRPVRIRAYDDVAELRLASSAVPWVCTLNWNCVASLVGRAPIRPTAACTFCDWITAMMSAGTRFSATSRSLSNQIRIE